MMLLAVLAMLQVRVAFAACEVFAREAAGAMAPCGEVQSAVTSHAEPMDEPMSPCPEQCADAYLGHDADALGLATARSDVPAAALLLVVPSAYPTGGRSSRIRVVSPGPPPPPLIYVLQRLLI